MTIRRALPIAVALSAAAAFLATVPATASPKPTGWVTQVGTYDRLANSQLAGLVRVDAVTGDATIGLGTFGGLDGELVMIGGTVYRVGTDGTPRKASDRRRTPFFEGIRFRPSATVSVPAGTACAELTPLIDEAAGGANGMVAVRVRGTFADLTTRSVPRQVPPYPTLADVVAQQVVFPLGAVSATLVGFRGGQDVAGIPQAGLHLHGLTTDRTAGGHVLSCVVGDDVTLSVQVAEGIAVVAPVK